MDYTSNMLEENQPSSLEPVFLEHPSNTLVNYQPSVVKCVVRNSAQTDIICDGQKRNDVIRKKNLADGSETLSILVRQKDFLDKQKTTCRCIAISNIYNDQIFSNEAILGKAYLEGDFLSEPMDEIAYVDDTIELRCDPPQGEPEPNVYWLKDNVRINVNLDSSRIKISNDFSLLILSAKKEDAGAYVCVAKNKAGVALSNPAKLVLLEKSQKYTWSEWSNWSSCPLNCNEKETSKRYRHCQTTNKIAQLEKVPFYMCNKDKTFEIKECPMVNCEQENWSDWSDWSECSAECKQYRYRTCNKSRDNQCNEEKLMMRKCEESQCKVDQLKHMLTNKFNSINADHRSTTKSQVETNFHGSNVNKGMIGFSVGTAAVILALLFVITCMILFFLKKRVKHNFREKKLQPKSERDIYYVYEKQIEQGKCLLFNLSNKRNDKPSRIGNTSTAIYNEPVNLTTARVYQNELFGVEKFQFYRNYCNFYQTQRSDIFTDKSNQRSQIHHLLETESQGNHSLSNENSFRFKPISLGTSTQTNADEQIYETVDPFYSK